MAYITCKHCGCQMSDKSESCPVCGASVQDNIEQNDIQQEIPSAENTETTTASQNKRNWILLSVILVVVIAALVCGIFIIQKNNQKAKAEQLQLEQQLAEQKRLQQEQQAQYEQQLEEQNRQDNSVIPKNDKSVKYVVIDGDELRLRLGPSIDSDTFKWKDGTNRHPKKGEQYPYLGEYGDFYKIDFKGNELWVSKQYTYVEDMDARIQSFIESFSRMTETSDNELVYKLYAPSVKRYHNAYDTDVDYVAECYSKYDEKFGVYGKHSSVRWNTVSYNKTNNIVSLTYIEDYSIDRTDPSKYSVFVLEKHFELNEDFQIVSIYDVQLSKSKK